MEKVLKQRLVGALVLVALCIIFIPMLLDGDRPVVEQPLLSARIPVQPKPSDETTLTIRREDLTDLHNQLTELSPTPDATLDAGRLLNNQSQVITMPTASVSPVVSQPVETGAWVIQLGSFADKTNARSLRDKLRAKGFAVYLSPVRTVNGVIIRVFVGPEIDRGKAEKIAVDLNQQFQLKGIIVSYNPTTT